MSQRSRSGTHLSQLLSQVESNESPARPLEPRQFLSHNYLNSSNRSNSSSSLNVEEHASPNRGVLQQTFTRPDSRNQTQAPWSQTREAPGLNASPTPNLRQSQHYSQYDTPSESQQAFFAQRYAGGGRGATTQESQDWDSPPSYPQNGVMPSRQQSRENRSMISNLRTAEGPSKLDAELRQRVQVEAHTREQLADLSSFVHQQFAVVNRNLADLANSLNAMAKNVNDLQHSFSELQASQVENRELARRPSLNPNAQSASFDEPTSVKDSQVESEATMVSSLFQCEFCNRTFKGKPGLASHQRGRFCAPVVVPQLPARRFIVNKSSARTMDILSFESEDEEPRGSLQQSHSNVRDEWFLKEG